jgi:predicted acylesterase/phospholipase RssA
MEVSRGAADLTMKRSAVALLAVALLFGCAGAPERQVRKDEDLLAERRAAVAAAREDGKRLIAGLLARAEAKARTPRPTMDLLIISGGGDWGAFGAGVLKGWGRVKGEMARPQFDGVTGVSTGALIAPFAFVGDDDSIERIVQLYRNPAPDIAESRGLLFFWPSNPSLYVLPGLERELRTALDRGMLERIAAQQPSGRLLLVNTTNVDLGEMRAWDVVAQARAALAADDPGRVHRILLASAGIPAVFPAREIGSHLYVDGAVTGNILYGARIDDEQGMVAQWRAKHGRAPPPRIRYWVIFNNQFRFPPQVTRARWPDIMSRTTIMATQNATISAMRHLEAHIELMRVKYRIDVELRIMAVPESWVPSEPGTFKKEVMNALADLGEKMGADPASWSNGVPESQ